MKRYCLPIPDCAASRTVAIASSTAMKPFLEFWCVVCVTWLTYVPWSG